VIGTVTLEFATAEEAEHVLSAIQPDNTPLPPGIEILCEVSGQTLVIRIECDRGIDSFRATIEDLMSAVDLSLRTLVSV
jgi:tRNA threonylcarbamoyladenosine modification (KEOPS) complex  Pcc1 subunit